MNNLYPNLIKHIFSYINRLHKYSRISKKYYEILKDTEVYQYEQLRAEWIIDRNKKLMESKDIDIEVLGGNIYRAYFYLIGNAGIKCDDLDGFIINNSFHLQEACKKFRWRYISSEDGKSGQIDGIMEIEGREKEVLSDKTIALPIRNDWEKFKCDNINIYKIPLYYYNYLKFETEDGEWECSENAYLLTSISKSKMDVDFCNFIMASDSNIIRHKSLLRKLLSQTYENMDAKIEIHKFTYNDE